MNIKRIMSSIRRPLALIMSLLMLFALAGCMAYELTDTELKESLLPNETEARTAVFTDEEAQTDAPIEADTSAETETTAETQYETQPKAPAIDEDGYYYSRDEVALYIHTYGKLPSNFITKSEAGELGWEGGSAERYRDGAAIGGDKFGNREGLLPKANGRIYYECDIDTDGGKPRGAKRIVYSNDGLIYYTDDHYESFILLYGEE